MLWPTAGSLNAGWDRRSWLRSCRRYRDIDFDIGITGFSIPEIDGLIEGAEARGAWRS